VADPQRVELGRVVGAHALAGQVRVRFFGDGPENLLGSRFVFLADRRDDPSASRYAVQGGGSGRGGEVRLSLAGVEDREGAEALRGSLVLVDSADLEPLGEDEFYWHELIGCTVETEAGELIGTVRELWNTGSHDVLVVMGERGQVLVPTAREIMKRVDLGDARIVIDPVPGLLGDAEGK
jgi:16S rRNA processing protein RimM